MPNGIAQQDTRAVIPNRTTGTTNVVPRIDLLTMVVIHSQPCSTHPGAHKRGAAWLSQQLRHCDFGQCLKRNVCPIFPQSGAVWTRSGRYRYSLSDDQGRMGPSSAKARTAHTRLRAPASDAIAHNWGRARAFECYLFPLEYNRAIGPRPDCNRLQSLRAQVALVRDCTARFRVPPCQGLFASGRSSSDG